MKRIFSAIICLVAITLFALPSSAIAANSDAGAQVFKSNCVTCHLKGANKVNPAKTLSKADLEKYGKLSLEAIITQVTNGAGAMPSFKRLGADKIEDVAAYVLQQAEAGW